MNSLTLGQLFGVNASQDNQALIIRKSDLPLLTPLNNNTAESLLSAILVKALNNLQGTIQTETGELITDENGKPLEFDNRDYFCLNIFRWRNNLIQRDKKLFIRKTIVIEEFIDYED